MREEMFVIKSSSSDRELRFLARHGDEFQVELSGYGLTLALKVSAYTDSTGLLRLFEKIASHATPWRGKESWRSLEGEFILSVSCSTSGQVYFFIEAWGSPGAAEEWRASAGITSELGQLPSIASAAHRFFCGADA